MLNAERLHEIKLTKMAQGISDLEVISDHSKSYSAGIIEKKPDMS